MQSTYIIVRHCRDTPVPLVKECNLYMAVMHGASARLTLLTDISFMQAVHNHCLYSWLLYAVHK